MVATIALMVATAALWLLVRDAPAPRPVTRFEIAVPSTDSPTSLALSPDGRQLAYVATTDGQSRLWVRLLDDTDARALAGTEGASFPFWAPDARAIAFFAEGKLKRVDLAGGTPQVLADAPGGRGGTWSSDGVILFTPGNISSASNSVITRVSAAGGTPMAVTPVGRDDGVLASAFSASPGTLAYRATGGSQRRQLVWMDHNGKMVGSIGSPDNNNLAALALDPAGQRIAV
jgi:WD40 repeat protein